jgi:hypothetical protein
LASSCSIRKKKAGETSSTSVEILNSVMETFPKLKSSSSEEPLGKPATSVAKRKSDRPSSS